VRQSLQRLKEKITTSSGTKLPPKKIEKRKKEIDQIIKEFCNSAKYLTSTKGKTEITRAALRSQMKDLIGNYNRHNRLIIRNYGVGTKKDWNLAFADEFFKQCNNLFSNLVKLEEHFSTAYLKIRGSEDLLPYIFTENSYLPV
jgi:uncharacterized protein YecA (UPF0149 family)